MSTLVRVGGRIEWLGELSAMAGVRNLSPLVVCGEVIMISKSHRDARRDAGFSDWIAPVGSRRERAIVSMAEGVFRWSEAGNGQQSHTDEADVSRELFEGLPRRQLQRATRYFTFVNVKAGVTLGRQGRPGRDFLVVESGRVAVSIDGIAVAVLGPGCHFGELPLLDPQRTPRRMATFLTLEPCSIAVANRREFWSLLSEFPVVADRIGELAVERIAYVRKLPVPDGPDDLFVAPPGFPVHVGEHVG